MNPAPAAGWSATRVQPGATRDELAEALVSTGPGRASSPSLRYLLSDAVTSLCWTELQLGPESCTRSLKPTWPGIQGAI